MRYTLIILMLIFTLPTHSQDITNKLGGSTASDTYDVIDSNNEILLRVQGDGRVGIGATTLSRLVTLDGQAENAYIAIYNSQSGNTANDGLLLGMQSSTNNTYFWNYENSPIFFATNNSTRMYVAADGDVGINTTSPDYKLEVNGTAGKVGGGSWSNSSDIRLKDITGEYEQGLEGILKLRPITYKYKKNNARELSSEDEYIGFVAQEVQEHFPEAVSEGKDGYLDFNMHSINVAVINAIQELAEENKVLKARIEELERK